MYTITSTYSGGTIQFDTIAEIEKFFEGAVYGILLEAKTHGYELPVGEIAELVTDSFSMEGVEIDPNEITSVVSNLVGW